MDRTHTRGARSTTGGERRAGKALVAVIVAFSALLSASARAESLARAIARAEKAVASGEVVPERDLAPLLERLERTHRESAAEDLIDAIEELGDAGGLSPAAVKRYLRENAPPVLLQVASRPFDWTTRGDALMALRSLDALDADLEAAIALGRSDTSPQRGFLASRADLLESWMHSRRRRSAIDEALRVEDPSREQAALEQLRARRLGASVDTVVRFASQGDVSTLELLLDAGVQVEARNGSGTTAMSAAIHGCQRRGVSNADIVATVDLLLARGADIEQADDLGNTLLFRAAQSCDAEVVSALLERGARVSPINAQGFTPLALALATARLDVAEVLVDHGARLSANLRDQIFLEPPTDPRWIALLGRAAEDTASTQDPRPR